MDEIKKCIEQAAKDAAEWGTKRVKLSAYLGRTPTMSERTYYQARLKMEGAK